MGHKVNPKIFRVGLSENWNSRWFANGQSYIKYLKEDTRIRKYLVKKLKDGGVGSIEIERSLDNLNINIYTSKPGIIIGRGGAGIEDLKKYIQKKIVSVKSRSVLGWKNRPSTKSGQGKIKININIKEISKPQLSAQIVAQNIALELEKRIPYRRAMKRNIDTVLKVGAQGIKVICAGRLNGAEIARTETLTQGKIPLHTIRADIDYGLATAETTYGAIGVKVWIYKGEVFEKVEEKKIKK